MYGSRSEPERQGSGSKRISALISPLPLLALVVLSVWAVAYQLTDTVAPALANDAPFSGCWPDLAFALAGMMLIVRGANASNGANGAGSAGGGLGWVLLGLGCVCWASGDVYWSLKLANMSSPPVPSWADAGYIAFYPLAFAGVLTLVRRQVKAPSRMLVADAAAAALAVAAVNVAVVVQPVLEHTHGGTLSFATNLAYPVGDLILLGLLVGASALDEWRVTPAWLLLGISIVAFWVADSFYLTSVATDTYSQGQAYNGLWYLSPVVAVWAAWFGLRASAATPIERGTRVRGIAMLLAVCCAALTILVWSDFHELGVPAIVLATAALVTVMVRLLMTWRENMRLLALSQGEATTDMLTGLPNRRALMSDLERRLALVSDECPLALVLFDLDGFKHYNDSFGHPAGDALLQRLGTHLSERLGRRGMAYRMGGDEFCVLIDVPLDQIQMAIDQAAGALSESGEGFAIGCSYGTVVLPSEAQDAQGALRIADQRMYAQKRGSRASASRQSGDVLLRALAERDPNLRLHVKDVAELAAETARSFGLPAEEIEPIRQGAELHDVGKMAIPDAILTKPATLDEDEWAFIRRHTLIGERIINAAPALHRVAALVRSSHENFDGTGYPDRLAGEQIPLGSRIISVCDAFNAMTTDRAYRQAIGEDAAVAELWRCAGSQFDPEVVARFCGALVRRRDGRVFSPAA